MAGRGGARPGAGRPKGSRNNVTVQQQATITALAQKHGAAAIKALVQIATTGESEAARVSAANAILDRGFGKPLQAIEHTGPDGKPLQMITTTMTPQEAAAAYSDMLGGEDE